MRTSFLIIFILGVLIFPWKGQVSDVSIQIQVIEPSAFCGNNVQEADEQCDGSDLADQTCVTFGYASGALGCNDDCTFDTSGCARFIGGGGGGGVYVPPPPETKVILQGKAYPLSSVTILKDGQVAAITESDSQANFEVELTALTAGTYTFGVWGEDSDGRKSIVFSFTVSVASGTITTVSGIFLPPTIELDKTSLKKGEVLNILGQTAPISEISISIRSPEIVKITTADEEGLWGYSLDTIGLDEGTHSARAKATSPEELQSSFSQALSFNVGKEIPKEIPDVIKKADINGDDRVNLVDFSILLYNWGIPKSPAADLNSDGKVDLADFSIMMYWWTG